MLLLSFFICLAATTIGAISGIGGGVLIKPLFDAFSGLSVSTISFLSGCTVFAMAIVSLLRSRGGEVKVEPKRGTLLAAGAAAGGVLGKQLFDVAERLAGNGNLVGILQNTVMILISVGVFLYVVFRSRIRTRNLRNSIGCVAVGLGLGIMSAFLGIGGGPINLAVLYFFFSMDTKTAALNSIYIILFSQAASFASTLLLGRTPPFDPFMLACMIAGGVLGGFLGRAFSKRMSNGQVDLLFRWILVVIGLISVYNLIRFYTG